MGPEARPDGMRRLHVPILDISNYLLLPNVEVPVEKSSKCIVLPVPCDFCPTMTESKGQRSTLNVWKISFLLEFSHVGTDKILKIAQPISVPVSYSFNTATLAYAFEISRQI